MGGGGKEIVGIQWGGERNSGVADEGGRVIKIIQCQFPKYLPPPSINNYAPLRTTDMLSNHMPIFRSGLFKAASGNNRQEQHRT